MPSPDGCISLWAPLLVRVRLNAKERCDLTSPSLLPDRGSRTETKSLLPAAVISVLIASAAADFRRLHLRVGRHLYFGQRLFDACLDLCNRTLGYAQPVFHVLLDGEMRK